MLNPNGQPPPKTDGMAVYTKVRDRLLSLQGPPLAAPPAPGELAVQGVLMEVADPGLTWTLMAWHDGTTSLYFSTGGGIIGAGEKPRVQRAQRPFLSFAREIADELEPTDSHPLPELGNVRFSIVSSAGVRAREVSKEALEGGRHELTSLYQKAHELVAALRQATPTGSAPSHLRRRDHLLQASLIVLGVVLGALAGSLTARERLPGALGGSVAGLLVGFLVSGTVLLVIGARRKRRQNA